MPDEAEAEVENSDMARWSAEVSAVVVVVPPVMSPPVASGSTRTELELMWNHRDHLRWTCAHSYQM